MRAKPFRPTAVAVAVLYAVDIQPGMIDLITRRVARSVAEAKLEVEAEGVTRP